MRRIFIAVLVLASGCGGAIDASGVQTGSDAAQVAAAPARPIVGTLRMRDRDIPLTADALDARGNEDLREMTAQAPGVMADIAPEHSSRGEAHRSSDPDLSAIQGDLF